MCSSRMHECVYLCIYEPSCVFRIMWCTSDISILCFLAWTAWSRRKGCFSNQGNDKSSRSGSRASTPQPLSQSYDSHCGQQAIAKSTAIRCTSAASYICLFLDMCVRLELQNEHVCHDHTKCPISRYNTYIYIYTVYIYIYRYYTF